jgi:hypothetical protein
MSTHDEAIAHKRSLEVSVVPKRWLTAVVPNAAAAVALLNRPPAQVAGEAFASNRADGQVDLYYFL